MTFLFRPLFTLLLAVREILRGIKGEIFFLLISLSIFISGVSNGRFRSCFYYSPLCYSNFVIAIFFISLYNFLFVFCRLVRGFFSLLLPRANTRRGVGAVDPSLEDLGGGTTPPQAQPIPAPPPLSLIKLKFPILNH